MSRAIPALRSALTCPQCGTTAVETMPPDACQFFYDCQGCNAVLRPKSGDCCVFRSYGSVQCPPNRCNPIAAPVAAAEVSERLGVRDVCGARRRVVLPRKILDLI